MADADRPARDAAELWHSTPIAIVGMGGVFPGASSLDHFWRNIVDGVDVSREPPPGRWVLDPSVAFSREYAPDKVASTRACFVEHDPTIDDEGLDLDPHLIAGLDPLYRLVLRAGIDAFRDSEASTVDGARTGAILAAIALPTEGASRLTRCLFGSDQHREGGFKLSETEAQGARVTSLPATLLARALSLNGVAYTLDAACASSLYAIKLACDELQLGRADAMLAGGVSRPDSLFTQMGFTQLRALSPSGRCRPFDARADGLIVGEGAGIVLLKRLADAIQSGDRIHAVIRGIGLSNDIGGSLLAPDSEGQQRATLAAYRAAGWSPSDVDLIECHGTGTPLGDAAEIRGLRALWGESGWRQGQCAIGSVKSNVGHLLTAAGAAGLIKTLLAMRAGELPPSANYETPDERLQLDQSPFRVQTRCEAWRRRDDQTPRRAAINGFGFGGINAQMLVEEWRPGSAIGTNAASPVDRQITKSPNHQIAIVGLAARFGTAASLREFQECVLGGRDAMREPPVDRWRGCDERVRQALDLKSCRGGFIDHIDIPFGRFRLPPSEVAEVLPQQLLMLQVAAEAMG
ncbi:MAG: type I polyketide synthase, partial [Planctomycetes bacterium]|nr:type I polyketide synthase [Planctomycetota bacterium]